MRRTPRTRRPIVGILAVMMMISCSRSLEPRMPAASPPEVRTIPDHFSGEIAEAHMASLGRLGPRPPGSPADRAARLYLSDRFEAAGAEVRVLRDGPRRHLVAELAGASDDVLLLVAAYPALARDGWMGDSGPALLLELARVLALSPQPYSVQFALAQTTGPAPDGVPASIPSSVEAGFDAAGNPHRNEFAEARHQVVVAGESLARLLADEGEFEGLRGVIVFEGLARPQLRIARDLRSHPIYREIFWQSAAALGQTETFPKNAGWASAQSLNLGFEQRGMDRVLALVDEALARPERVAMAPTASSHSATSLGSVGVVTIEALARIMHRLSRIDAFSAGGEQPETSGQASPQVIESPPSI